MWLNWLTARYSWFSRIVWYRKVIYYCAYRQSCKEDRWVLSCAPRPRYSPDRAPCTHWEWVWTLGEMRRESSNTLSVAPYKTIVFGGFCCTDVSAVSKIIALQISHHINSEIDFFEVTVLVHDCINMLCLLQSFVQYTVYFHWNVL
jgi:hypothetical protein